MSVSDRPSTENASRRSPVLPRKVLRFPLARLALAFGLAMIKAIGRLLRSLVERQARGRSWNELTRNLERSRADLAKRKVLWVRHASPDRRWISASTSVCALADLTAYCAPSPKRRQMIVLKQYPSRAGTLGLLP